MGRVIELVADLAYDACALTGDYRGKTFGPFKACLDGVEEVVSKLSRPVFGVLGNHDTIRMVPRLENMGVRMLLNECVTLERGGSASDAAVAGLLVGCAAHAASCGLGGGGEALQSLGIRPERRVRAVRECVEIIRAAASGQRVNRRSGAGWAGCG